MNNTQPRDRANTLLVNASFANGGAGSALAAGAAGTAAAAAASAGPAAMLPPSAAASVAALDAGNSSSAAVSGVGAAAVASVGGNATNVLQHVVKMDYVKFQKLGDDSVDLSRSKHYFWVADSQRRLIAYYKNDQSLKPKKTIDPTEVVSVAPSQGSRKFFVLIERRAAKTIQLRFKARFDRDEWLLALRTVLQAAASDNRVHNVVSSLRRQLNRVSHDLGFQITCDLDELAHQEALFPFFIDAIETGTLLLRKIVTTLNSRGMSLQYLISRAILHVNFINEDDDAAAAAGGAGGASGAFGALPYSTSRTPFAGTCYDPSAKQLEIGVDLSFGGTGAGGKAKPVGGAGDDNDENDGAGDGVSPRKKDKGYRARTVELSQAISMLSSTLWRNPQFEQWQFLDGESAQAADEMTRMLRAAVFGNNKNGGGNSGPFSVSAVPDFRFSLQWSHTLHESSNSAVVERYVKEFVNAGLLRSICDMIRRVLDDDEAERKAERRERMLREQQQSSASSSTSTPFEQDLPAAVCLARYVRGVGIQIDGVSVEQQMPPQLSLVLFNWEDPYITAAVSLSSRLRRLAKLRNSNSTSHGAFTGSFAGGANLGMGQSWTASGGFFDRAASTAISAVSLLQDRLLDIIAYARLAHACRESEALLSATLQLHDPVSVAWSTLADSVMVSMDARGSPTGGFHCTASMHNFQPVSSGSDFTPGSAAPGNNTNSNPLGAAAGAGVGGSGRRSPPADLGQTRNGAVVSFSEMPTSPLGGAAGSGFQLQQTATLLSPEAFATTLTERDLAPLVRQVTRILDQRYHAFVEHAQAGDNVGLLRRIVRKCRVRFQNSARGDVALLATSVDRGVITDTMAIVIAPLRGAPSPNKLSSSAAAYLHGVAPARDVVAPMSLEEPLWPIVAEQSVYAGFQIHHLVTWFRGFVMNKANLVPFPVAADPLLASATGRSAAAAAAGGGGARAGGDSEDSDDEEEQQRALGELVGLGRMAETRILTLDVAVSSVYDNQGADPMLKVSGEEILRASKSLNDAFPAKRVVMHDLARVLGMTLRKARALFEARAKLRDKELAAAAGDADVALLRKFCDFPEAQRDLPRLVQAARQRQFEAEQQDRIEKSHSLSMERLRTELGLPQQQQPVSSPATRVRVPTVTPDGIPFVAEVGDEDDDDDGAAAAEGDFTNLVQIGDDTEDELSDGDEVLVPAQQQQQQQQRQLRQPDYTPATGPAARYRVRNGAASGSPPAVPAQQPTRQQPLSYQEFAAIILHHLVPLEAKLSLRARRNVLFVGLHNTGKSLIAQSMRDDFAGTTPLAATEPTIGLTTTLVPFAEWVIGCRELGGREQQRSYAREFEPMLGELHGVVCVVDAAAPSTRGRRPYDADRAYLLEMLALKALRGLPVLLLVNNMLAPKARATEAVLEHLDWAAACAAGDHAQHAEQRCSIVAAGAGSLSPHTHKAAMAAAAQASSHSGDGHYHHRHYYANRRTSTFHGEGAKTGFMWLCRQMNQQVAAPTAAPAASAKK